VTRRPRRPNILFLLSDEHSYRCLGFRGCRTDADPRDEAEPVDTPTLDALAGRGVAFDRAYCQVPLCTPSRICLLTGCDPVRSGGWDNGSRLSPGRPTLASTFADAGYATCLVGKMHLGGPHQFVGFQHRPYGDLTGNAGHQPEPLSKPGGGLHGMRSRTADAGVTEIPEPLLQERATNGSALAWLREHRHQDPDQPWLLMASYSRPHFPLTAPRRWVDRYWPNGVTEPKIGRSGDSAHHPMTRGMADGFETEAIDHDEMMYARACYFACVSQFDEMLGDLFATLSRDGLLDNTVVVYTSDHGELAGEHGMWWKNSWHEAAARVPLIVSLPEHRGDAAAPIAGPRRRPGEAADRGAIRPPRMQTPVSLADLYPTLCGLAGIEPPDDLDGTDLSAAIREQREPGRGPVTFVNPTPRWGEGCEHVVRVDWPCKYVAFRGAGGGASGGDDSGGDASGGVPDLLFDLDADPLEQRNLLAHGSDDDRVRGAAMRQAIEEQWDFDAAGGAQAEASEHARAYRWPPDGTPHAGNIYHMPDGRLVAADTPLYDPVVVAAKADDLIEDTAGRTVSAAAADAGEGR